MFSLTFNFSFRFIIAWRAFFIRKFSVPHHFHWSSLPATREDADFDLRYVLPFFVMEKISIAKIDICSAWYTCFAYVLFHLATRRLCRVVLIFINRVKAEEPYYNSALESLQVILRSLISTVSFCFDYWKIWHKYRDHILTVLRMIKWLNICNLCGTVLDI